jgi:hypothetical protein
VISKGEGCSGKASAEQKTYFSLLKLLVEYGKPAPVVVLPFVYKAIKPVAVAKKKDHISVTLSKRGVSRDRTGDTRIFSPLLYRLSYRTILSPTLFGGYFPFGLQI